MGHPYIASTDAYCIGTCIYLKFACSIMHIYFCLCIVIGNCVEIVGTLENS